MDFASTFIGLITITIFVFPFIYSAKQKKKEQKVFLQKFLISAEKQNIAISQSEVWQKRYGIGVDNSSLYYYKQFPDRSEDYLIDLKLVETAKVKILHRSTGTGKNAQQIVDKLELLLHFKDKHKADKTLEFYNSSESMSLNDELDVLKKWVGVVNSQIATI